MTRDTQPSGNDGAVKSAKASQLTRATFGLSYVLAVTGIIILAVTVGVGVKVSLDLNRIAGLADEAHLETIPRDF